MPKAKIDHTLQKLKTLTHYICHKCDLDDLGATKLNKVLWYADVEWYLQTGDPITGETYIKRQHGPMSKHFYQVIDELSDEGAIHQRGAEYYGYEKTEYIPLKQPDISAFKPEQISLVDDVIDFVCRQHTARSISVASHDVVWEAAMIGEEIPLYAAWASRPSEITEEDIKWAHEKLASKRAI